MKVKMRDRFRVAETNTEGFCPTLMFQISKEELDAMRSQNVISNTAATAVTFREQDPPASSSGAILFRLDPGKDKPPDLDKNKKK